MKKMKCKVEKQKEIRGEMIGKKKNSQNKERNRKK